MKKYKVLLTLFSVVLMFIFLHNKIDLLLENPLAGQFQFKNPALATVNNDNNNNFCVVDDSGQRIVNINNDEVLGTIVGGKNSNETFYQCRDIAIDNNNIYLINIVLENNGMQIAKENILHYNAQGEFLGKIYEFNYSKEHQPSFLGWLLSLKIINNNLYFVYAAEHNINIYQVIGAEVSLVKSIAYDNANSMIINATLDENCTLYITTKTGQLIKISDKQEVLYSGNGFNDEKNSAITAVPWDISVDNQQNIYFTDIGSRRIKKISNNNVETVINANDEQNFGANPIYNRVKVSATGKVLVTTDTHSWIIKTEDKINSYQTLDYNLKFFLQKQLVWLVFICSIVAICFLLKKLIAVLLKYNYSNIEKNGLMIFVVGTIMAIIVGSVILSNSYKLLNKQIVNNIAAMTDMVSAYGNGDDLARFKRLQDYNNADHRSFKGKLDKIIGKSYDNNDNFYYVIYKTDGESVYQVMNYSNTFCPLTTLDTNYSGSYYEQVVETKTPIVIEEFKDSTGYWTYAVGPIFDSQNKVVGLVEIGRNLYAIKEEQKKIIINTIFDVLTAIIVIFLLLTELLYLTEYLKQRFNNVVLNYDETVIAVIRPLSFILLVADFMQNSFTPIYVTKIYEPIFNLPAEIGIAIPLSAEVCTTAIFAWLGGSLKTKLGLKKLLFSGATISLLGFLICGILPNVIVFTIGKAVIGIGMGFVHVALLTFISEADNEKILSDGYAYYFASYFAAINIGCVIGGSLANFIGQRQVYFVAAATILGGIALGLYLLKNVALNISPKVSKTEQSKISLGKFLINPKIIIFFFFIFIPYLVMSYFLYYFFPLFADQNNITTTRIAQAFLLNGIFVVYLGPLLAPKLEKLFSKKINMIIGSLLSVVALGLFALKPSLTTAVIALIILGVADSFTFTAQNIYYNTLEIVNKFGISKANGIKNTFENIAYVMAPAIFGIAMLSGISYGILLIALTSLVLLGLFFINLENLKKG